MELSTGSIFRLSVAGVSVMLALTAIPVTGQIPSASTTVLTVRPVAEKTITSLPDQPIYWRVELFPDAVQAADGAAPEALIVENRGEAWRFTLGPRGHQQSSGRLLATIGPVPKPVATNYLLRINRASGPPGAATPIHTHPGSEAFYVLAGRMCQRTDAGTATLEAGHAMNGKMPGMVMQIQSCGDTPLDQFVMFVVDAQKPFSSPATFTK